MYEGLFQDETEQALEFRAANPRAPGPAKASVWSQAAELVASPFKGAAGGIAQSAALGADMLKGVASNLPDALAGPLGAVPAVAGVQAAVRTGADILSPRPGQFDSEAGISLRNVAASYGPDPVTSTTASTILLDGARILTKAGMYSLAGGLPGAVLGTGVDEAATGYNELRAKGVDPTTAAKAGAVRGAAVAAGVALPVAGRTVAQTAGLVAFGGPGLFVAEQATTRAILESAEYPHLALQYDPTDPVGLGVSLLVPGAVGAAVHRARARGAAAAGAPEPAEVATAEPVPTAPLPELLRSMPELQDAALVAHRSHVVDQHLLADPADLGARQSHAAAMEAAAKAMDEGLPVSVASVELDPVRAQQAMEQLKARIDAAEAELAPLRDVDDVPAQMDAVSSLDPAIPYRPPFPDGGFDIANLLAQARQMLLANGNNPGRLIDELTEQGRTVSPEMHNALVGMRDFHDRMPELMQQFRAIEWNRGGKSTPGDILADAVERMRAGDGPEVQNTPLGRAAHLALQQPRLAVRLDEGDGARSARELVDEVRMDARQDRKDAKAFAAAVECMLRTGS